MLGSYTRSNPGRAMELLVTKVVDVGLPLPFLIFSDNKFKSKE